MQSFAPYLIAFILCLTGSSVFFPNCELVLIALSSIEVIKPFSFCGMEIDLAHYQAGNTFLLAFSGAAGSAIGSCLFYFVGRSAGSISPKLKTQIEKFDFDRFSKSSSAITFTSSAFSLPPFTILSIATGMIRFPLWKYLAVSLIGKTTRFAIVAFTGGAVIPAIVNFFRHLF